MAVHRVDHVRTGANVRLNEWMELNQRLRELANANWHWFHNLFILHGLLMNSTSKHWTNGINAVCVGQTNNYQVHLIVYLVVIVLNEVMNSHGAALPSKRRWFASVDYKPSSWTRKMNVNTRIGRVSSWQGNKEMIEPTQKISVNMKPSDCSCYSYWV